MPQPNQILAVLRRAGMLDLGTTPAVEPIDGGTAWRVEGFVVQTGTATAAAFIDSAAAIRPGAVPRLHHFDPTGGALVVECLSPCSHAPLVRLARDGRLDGRHGAALGALFADLHGATWGRASIGAAFVDDLAFKQKRIEPLLLVAAEAQRDAAAALKRVARRCTGHRTALVHAGPGIEGLLWGPAGPVLLDGAAAHMGDPAFDVALLLADMMILAEAEPRAGQGLLDAAHSTARTWHRRLGRLKPDEAETAELVAALALGRLSGRMPLPAVPPDAADAVRARAKTLLSVPRPTVAATLRGLRE